MSSIFSSHMFFWQRAKNFSRSNFPFTAYPGCDDATETTSGELSSPSDKVGNHVGAMRH